MKIHEKKIREIVFCSKCKNIIHGCDEFNKNVICKMCQRVENVRKKYGVNISEMLKMQDGCCAICRRKGSELDFVVDHSHRTGEVRGVLCYSCNSGIGQLGDDPLVIRAAYLYLQMGITKSGERFLLCLKCDRLPEGCECHSERDKRELKNALKGAFPRRRLKKAHIGHPNDHLDRVK